jgi:hypothetical protein
MSRPLSDFTVHVLMSIPSVSWAFWVPAVFFEELMRACKRLREKKNIYRGAQG